MGRKASEPNIREKLPQRNDILEDLFICSIEEFEGSDSKTNTFPLVYCTDIPRLIVLICKKHDLHILQIKIKIGVDFGKQHLRVTMSIWDPEDILSVWAVVREPDLRGSSQTTWILCLMFTQHNLLS